MHGGKRGRIARVFCVRIPATTTERKSEKIPEGISRKKNQKEFLEAFNMYFLDMLWKRWNH